eukprot:COSAG03_NODE_13931_length_483_cov_5.625000_1_plen_64_part_00
MSWVAIAAATRAEAEVRGLKRKYEPDDGVIMDKMLQLSDDHNCVYMRVLIRTGDRFTWKWCWC